MASKPSFFAELKRRNVLRAGLLYIGAVWVLGQGFAQLGPVIYMPDWVVRWFLVAAGIAFPFWLALAWTYEWTPEGLKREREIAPEDSTARRTGRKLDLAIIAVLAVAVVLLLTDRLVTRGDGEAALAASAPPAPGATAARSGEIPEKSVAVLPLTNASGDSSNDYFVDGLSEQLISDLSRVESLRVIGRNSSFRFRGSTESPAEIAAQLGVAHLLEGTVRQSGERVRVVVGLVHAADGRSVWSQSFDRELRDIFTVQTEIAQAVATALQGKMLGTHSVIMPPSGNLEAFQAVLQSFAVVRQGSEAEFRQATALLEKAIRLDPDYAYAYAQLSIWLLDGAYWFLSGAEQQQARAEARRLAGRALELAPDLPRPHLARAAVLRNLDFDHRGALAEVRRALELAPSSAATMHSMATLLRTLGAPEQAVDMYRRVIAADPLTVDGYSGLSTSLLALGRLDEAEGALRTAMAMLPEYTFYYYQLAVIEIVRGNAAAALRAAEQVSDPSVRAVALALAQQIAGDRQAADSALHAYIAQYGEAQPVDVADLYALRQQTDEMFAWLERAWKGRHEDVNTLLYDPFLLAHQHDPRFVAFARKVGLLAPGEVPGEAGRAPATVARKATRG